jgi:hypothetical protein
MDEHLRALVGCHRDFGKREVLTKGSSSNHAMKNVKSCFDVTLALAGRVLPKFFQLLPKMQRSMTESRFPA